ncbi:MAG TPA: aldolase/citrate lyase family protein [Gammaproteobacteria bacterium]|nr:aldolase/citrate lyase family protein [Gammaproteobacteria bacterium]
MFTGFKDKVGSCVVGALALVFAASTEAQQSAPRIFNTAKLKLQRGEQIVGGTVTSPDPDIYCAMANSGFDFLWIEMQHSPLTYQEVARMIWACRGAPAMPFIRVPDSTPGDIQKAMDIGGLGIIIPLVDSVEEIRSAVDYTMYPPRGKRSLGNGQYGALYGNDYRQIANDNVVIVAMIESPAGVAIADEIASVPGVDVVFAASTDLGSFSGFRQGQPDYEAMVTTIHDATLEAKRRLGGPLAWRNRKDFTFFQAPTESSFIRLGVEAALKAAPSGQAPTEGAER